MTTLSDLLARAREDDPASLEALGKALLRAGYCGPGLPEKYIAGVNKCLADYFEGLDYWREVASRWRRVARHLDGKTTFGVSRDSWSATADNDPPPTAFADGPMRIEMCGDGQTQLEPVGDGVNIHVNIDPASGRRIARAMNESALRTRLDDERSRADTNRECADELYWLVIRGLCSIFAETFYDNPRRCAVRAFLTVFDSIDRQGFADNIAESFDPDILSSGLLVADVIREMARDEENHDDT